MDKRLRQITIALTIIGLLVSIYMTIYKVTINETMCIGSSDCSVVNASRYSEVNGIPVAVLGVAGYAAILALLFLEQRPGLFQQNGSMMFFGVSLLGFLFTLISDLHRSCADQSLLSVLFDITSCDVHNFHYFSHTSDQTTLIAGGMNAPY